MSKPKSPDYYVAGNVDSADVINAFELDYWSGSAVAHLLRAGRKPGESKYAALKNALGCIEHAIAAEQARPLNCPMCGGMGGSGPLVDTGEGFGATERAIPCKGCGGSGHRDDFKRIRLSVKRAVATEADEVRHDPR